MSQETIRFWVDGLPKGQPRPRAFARVGKAHAKARLKIRVYDPATAEGWKGLIALAARPLVPADPLNGPVWVDRHYYFPRPKRLRRKRDPRDPVPHAAKPDIDNMDKALFDALTSLGMWNDDAQIAGGIGMKSYVAISPSLARRTPGVDVRITTSIAEWASVWIL